MTADDVSAAKLSPRKQRQSKPLSDSFFGARDITSTPSAAAPASSQLLSSSPAFATPLHPIRPFNPHGGAATTGPAAKPTILPILLPPATLRPLAFRTFTKKHSLTLTSSALQELAAFIGRHCGSGWREEGLAERVLEETAKSWKNRNCGFIVDGSSAELKDILKSLEGNMSGGRVVHGGSSGAGGSSSSSSRSKDNSGGNNGVTLGGITRQDSLRLDASHESEITSTRLGLRPALHAGRPALLAREDSQVSTGLDGSMEVDDDGVDDDGLADPRRWLQVIGAFDQPRMLDTSKPSLLPNISQKTSVFRNRFNVIHQRLLRNDMFQSSAVAEARAVATLQSASLSSSSLSQTHRITPVANLLGRHGTHHMLLGMLVVLPTGKLSICDLSASITLDLSSAVAIPEDSAWFAPGMIVLVDGVYEEEEESAGRGLNGATGVGGTIGGRFQAFFMGQPPSEKRRVSLGISGPDGGQDHTIGGGFGWIDFLGVGSQRAVGARMRKLEQRLLQRQQRRGVETQPQHPGRHRVVVLGEVNLDQPQALQALKKILGLYASEAEGSTPVAFVLAGSFTEHAVMARGGSGGSIEYKEYFDALASTLADFPSLLQSATFVFVPGDNDGWVSSFGAGAAVPLPRKPVPDLFTSRVRRAFATANAEAGLADGRGGEAVWTTNPSRLSLFGPSHEIVLFRDDISSRLRRTAVRLASKAGEMEVDESQGSHGSQNTPIPHDLQTARKLVKTVLDQGYLAPFRQPIRPVHWDFAGALHLYPLPTVMVLIDTTTPPFCVTYEGCHVMNPGSLLVAGRRGTARWVESEIPNPKATQRITAAAAWPRSSRLTCRRLLSVFPTVPALFRSALRAPDIMASTEQLEIHSKSYIVRWAKVDEGHTISWSVQPHKKSMYVVRSVRLSRVWTAFNQARNFGIVKHPGTGVTNLTTFQSDLDDSSSILADGTSEAKAGLFANKGSAPEQLRKKGFKVIQWHGKCDADKVSVGTYDVQPGEAGMFGLVFDNTFSKQTSKNATFNLQIISTDTPPQAGQRLPNLQAPAYATGSGTSLARTLNPQLTAAASESVDSLGSHNAPASNSIVGVTSTTGNAGQPVVLTAAAQSLASPANYHVGSLMKRRRKKGQGYARRFFSLDYATCTLSYYYNRNSSALRGAIPLSLAAIAADERRREITVDSGAEVWHLKASSVKEFTDWGHALERASRIARGLQQGRAADDHKQPTENKSADTAPQHLQMLQEGEREWQQVEALVSRVVGTRDALRRLVKSTAAQQHLNQMHAAPAVQHLSPPEDADENVPSPPGPQQVDRKPFWRRKSSAATTPMSPQSFQPPVPALPSALTIPVSSGASIVTMASGKIAGGQRGRSGSSGTNAEEDSMHGHCQALLDDLDSVVSEFTNLLATSKQRRTAAVAAVNNTASAVSSSGGGGGIPRRSMDSTTSDEFFDAAEGDTTRPQVLRIDAHSEAEDTPGTDGEEASLHDESSVSSVEGEEEYEGAGAGGDDEDGNGNGSPESLFPAKPKSLTPLPVTELVKRRTTIPRSTVMPPSLIAFVRKNVGKDLSTISMPASANEPLSMLQRVAEQLEYAQLLDAAVTKKRADERLLYMAAFAVSQFAGGRVKERSIRKPWNPLLGETFELVRTETDVPGGLRLLVEKVSHRPVRLVMQADAAAWSFAQAPAPSQKFWGKSAEIVTEGRVRVVLRLPDGTEEKYSWTLATVFLRNVVVGEKYVEPVGTMHVINDSTGAKAAIEFRSKGMFGGRGEDVQIDALDSTGARTGLSVTGTWTQSLRLVEQGGGSGTEIWRAGPLVDDAAHVYGLTRFAASLNEITALERGRMAPTDTRLRPDQRLAEDGNLDEAEAWKTRLEEAQRTRRRQAEERGEEHRSRWFVKVATGPDGDEVWRLKGGKDGYWEERARGVWTGLDDLYSV
ncbi:oxysterol-binding protein 1 [Grosmannia clavigera kw1407]|uniref:DNA polymerase epsilon subunit B n=1 Tax=Grosmannia clavigera (strain kw1407 / UAMH 11150) TaxID=655863 RepID=F0XGR0_GROCL|nr:oxysterol-binding protein 1 [Grosmannia clavigera kw1407]EFX02771.1 oxysterol-binding protein 1 [Grosmannia clavigera kw1407]